MLASRVRASPPKRTTNRAPRCGAAVGMPIVRAALPCDAVDPAEGRPRPRKKGQSSDCFDGVETNMGMHTLRPRVAMAKLSTATSPPKLSRASFLHHRSTSFELRTWRTMTHLLEHTPLSVYYTVNLLRAVNGRSNQKRPCVGAGEDPLASSSCWRPVRQKAPLLSQCPDNSSSSDTKASRSPALVPRWPDRAV